MTPASIICSAIGGSNKEKRTGHVLNALTREGWAFAKIADVTQASSAGAVAVKETDAVHVALGHLYGIADAIEAALPGKAGDIRQHANTITRALSTPVQSCVTPLAGESGAVEALRELLDYVKSLKHAEGYCMCGSEMDAHDIGSGHAPVDMGEYYAAQRIERAEAALAVSLTPPKAETETGAERGQHQGETIARLERERDEARAQTSAVAKLLSDTPPYQASLAARVEGLLHQVEVNGGALAETASERERPPAARDILAERDRQKSVEGWSVEHDDAHRAGELVRAAVVYAMHAIADEHSRPYLRPSGWPWEDASWKPADPRRELVKAAALLHAEVERIDRIDRAALSTETGR